MSREIARPLFLAQFAISSETPKDSPLLVTAGPWPRVTSTKTVLLIYGDR